MVVVLCVGVTICLSHSDLKRLTLKNDVIPLEQCFGCSRPEE